MPSPPPARAARRSLVLLDAEMPELDGFETAAEINALRLQAPPRIVLTIGAWGEEVTDEARQVGVEYLLPQPFTPSLLLNIVSHALLDPESATAAPAPPVAAERIAAPPVWRGRRLLLVEDNELNQEVASGLLAESGFAVELAADGAAALDRVLGHSPDHYAAVLMDMQMPVMDGLAASRAIRRAPGYGALPIIAMTANATIEDRERALAAGMNDHVAKPIDPDGLRAALAAWVGGELPAAADMPASAPSVATPADLPTIAGLDTAAGLRRMMGNAAGYAELLRRFADGHRGDGAAIADLLQRGDRDAADRLAHTLKGLAGNLGAEEVAAAAAAAERALGDKAAAAALLHLDAVRGRLAAAIERHLPSPAPPRMGQAAPQFAGGTCQRLATLLADSDVAAIRFLTDNSEVLRDTLGEHFEAVARAAEGFDFAAALTALQRAVGDLAPLPEP
ncbi:MAG: response regulator [Thiohalocapsa sp.]